MRYFWARWGWAGRSGRWRAWSGAWQKRPARDSGASSCRRARAAASPTSTWSGWMGSVSSPTASPPDVGVVIVAAGAGVRAGPGEPKQFRPIHGVPMLLRTLRPFTSHPAVGQVVVAVRAGFTARPPGVLGECLVEGPFPLSLAAHTAPSVRGW